MKYLFCTIFIFAAAAVSAQEVTFSGYGAVGFRLLDREALLDANQETYFEGKFQADIEISKRISGQLDFRGDSKSKSVELREFTAKIELADWVNMKIGNPKKPFGSEQMSDQYELETIDRSIVHRNLAPLGYVERSPSLMFYHNYKEKDSGSSPIGYHLMLFKDNSLSYGIVGRLSYFVAPDWSISTSLTEQGRGGRNPIMTFGATADLTFETKKEKLILEGVFAQDPNEGIRLQQLGESADVYSLGAKLNLSKEFEVGDELLRSIEPVILVGYFVPDSRVMQGRTVQLLAGVNVYIHKHARFRLDIDKLDTRTPYSNISSSHDSRITLEFQMQY